MKAMSTGITTDIEMKLAFKGSVEDIQDPNAAFQLGAVERGLKRIDVDRKYTV